MESTDFLLANPWFIAVGVLISACITYLWYAYDQHKWPFRKKPLRW